MSARTLILASSSPRRSQLLRDLGVPFKVVPSEATELQPTYLSPHETCLINACRKARAVAKRYPDSLVVGADTLVFLGLKWFGKPASLDEALQMLSELQGQTHDVVTGVCLLHLRQHQQHVFAETTSVRFRTLTREDIADYLKVVNPLDKAGAYAIQEHGTQLVESIQGSFTNVVGLPLERLRRELSAFD